MRTRTDRAGGSVVTFSVFCVALLLVLGGFKANLLAQVPNTPAIPLSTIMQGARSVPYTIRVTPTATGAIATVPSTWYTWTAGSSFTGGARVVSARHLSSTTPALFTYNVGTDLASFMAISPLNLMPLLPLESRSMQAQTTSVGYRVETGAGSLANPTGLTGGPVEFTFWR